MKEFVEGCFAVIVVTLFALLGVLFVGGLALIGLAIEAAPYAVGIWVLHKLCGFPF